MRMDERTVTRLIEAASWSALIVLVCLLCAMTLGSCARRVYVPTETVRTDTVRQTRTEYLRDTVRETRILYQGVFDSVAPRLSETGEVTGWDHYRHTHTTDLSDRERTRHEATIDSLRDVSRQTQTVTRTVEVERPLTAWQTAQIWLGRAALAVLTAVVCLIILRRRKR